MLNGGIDATSNQVKGLADQTRTEGDSGNLVHHVKGGGGNGLVHFLYAGGGFLDGNAGGVAVAGAGGRRRWWFGFATSSGSADEGAAQAEILGSDDMQWHGLGQRRVLALGKKGFGPAVSGRWRATTAGCRRRGKRHPASASAGRDRQQRRRSASQSCSVAAASQLLPSMAVAAISAGDGRFASDCCGKPEKWAKIRTSPGPETTSSVVTRPCAASRLRHSSPCSGVCAEMPTFAGNHSVAVRVVDEAGDTQPGAGADDDLRGLRLWLAGMQAVQVAGVDGGQPVGGRGEIVEQRHPAEPEAAGQFAGIQLPRQVSQLRRLAIGRARDAKGGSGQRRCAVEKVAEHGAEAITAGKVGARVAAAADDARAAIDDAGQRQQSLAPPRSPPRITLTPRPARDVRMRVVAVEAEVFSNLKAKMSVTSLIHIVGSGRGSRLSCRRACSKWLV